jgi:hypothetical protein
MCMDVYLSDPSALSRRLQGGFSQPVVRIHSIGEATIRVLALTTAEGAHRATICHESGILAGPGPGR